MIVQHESFLHIIQEKLGGAVTELELIRHGTGNRVFTALWSQVPDEPPTRIIVRCFHGPRAFDDARTEADALRELCSDAYPVPEVYALIDDEDIPDAPFTIMQWLPGEPLTQVANADRSRIEFWLQRASDLMLRLHGLKWESGYEFLKPVLAPLPFADRMISWWEKQAEVLAFLGDPDIKSGTQWLRSHLYMTRYSATPTLIHRDFHPDNLLSDGQRITGVVDWGDLKIGDPAVDVAWTRMILSTEVNTALSETFIRGYMSRHPGIDETLPFWDAFSGFKRLMQILAYKAGQAERLNMWQGAGGLPRLVQNEQLVRDFLRSRLTPDEDA